MDHQEQLIKACLQHDRASQKRLYEQYAEVMLGLCYRYTKSMEDAEDVLQEGFVKVFTKLHQYKAEGELGAWIRRIMVNSALNFLRKNKQYRAALELDLPAVELLAENDPEVIMNTKELAELIRQLPTGYQVIFNLHAVEGYTHPEIGDLLGIAEGTSRSQYARARAQLITWLKTNNVDHKMQSHVK